MKSIVIVLLFLSIAAHSKVNDNLFNAVKKRNIIQVKELLNQGAKVLIDKGADINIKNNEGKTPLDLAQSDEMKKLLTTS